MASTKYFFSIANFSKSSSSLSKNSLIARRLAFWQIEAISAPTKPSVSLARLTSVIFLPNGLPLVRSEEHTSELQSLAYLVCRLLLEKKKRHKRRTFHCSCWIDSDH